MDAPAPQSELGTADADDASAVSGSDIKIVETVINGAVLRLDKSGGVYWPDQRALIVADLHLEKGSAFAKHGRFLPPYDTAHTLDRLERLIERYRPRLVLCLGDSFHDQTAGHRIAASDLQRLTALVRGRNWVWVCGNHDPLPMHGIPGETVADWRSGPLVLRHEANADCTGDLSGHFHPTALVATRAHRVRRRCFVHDDNRLILPAFGAYTGGLNILSPPIKRLFPRRFETWLIGDQRLFAVPRKRLLRDASS